MHYHFAYIKTLSHFATIITYYVHTQIIQLPALKNSLWCQAKSETEDMLVEDKYF